MLGRVLYAAAFLLLLIYTMDSQPTDKVEGVGDDFVGDGQDKTPIKQKRNSCQRIVVSADTPIPSRLTQELSSFALRGQLNHLGARLRLRPTQWTGKRGA